MNIPSRIVALGLVALALAPRARASTFSGSSADITDFAGGSEVSTRGTLISAVNLLNDNVGGVGVSTTINGVLFKGTQPGAFFEGNESFEQASFVYHGGDGYADPGLWSSGGAYDTLADSQIFNIDSPDINAGDGFGVINLTPGQTYELQVFMLDDRAGVSKTFPIQFQQVHFTGNFDQYDAVGDQDLGYIDGITIGGNGVTQANGEIATVTFSIDEGFNGLFVNTWNNGAFNGMQLRQVTPLAGDLDGNHAVDGHDVILWQQGLGTTYDASVLADIKSSYGQSQATPSIGATPEPATLALAGLAITAICLRSGRRNVERAPHA